METEKEREKLIPYFPGYSRFGISEREELKTPWANESVIFTEKKLSES